MSEEQLRVMMQAEMKAKFLGGASAAFHICEVACVTVIDRINTNQSLTEGMCDSIVAVQEVLGMIREAQPVFMADVCGEITNVISERDTQEGQ